MLKIFFKPKLKTTLINGGKSIKVKLTNATADEAVTILYLTIKQVAKYIGLEHRNLMNKLIELDKIVQKSKNKQKKELYTLEQKIKHQK